METPATTMREITTHHDGAVNDQITLLAYPDKTVGGAADQYSWSVKGQQGSIHPLQFSTVGGVGLTHEVLLAIIADRLQNFQAGPFPCFENERALNHVREALILLQHRTAQRLLRGVEGKLEK